MHEFCFPTLQVMVFYLFALFHVTDTSRALVWRMSLNQKGLLLQKAAFCFSSSSSTLHCKNRPQKLVQTPSDAATFQSPISVSAANTSPSQLPPPAQPPYPWKERTLWVVRSSGERKKVNPRGEVSLANDDLIELIPGHQLVLPGSHERSAKKARKEGDDSDDVEAIPSYLQRFGF
ncbi:unnamed protein product [Brassica napus]|uniref:(rape) hypothetical protein n=1 Tax=Brassica napus TaxID=3708 RepID=A0A816I2P8_BRANA|nr:unnamed protein product [Brassica napus]